MRRLYTTPALPVVTVEAGVITIVMKSLWEINRAFVGAAQHLVQESMDQIVGSKNAFFILRNGPDSVRACLRRASPMHTWHLGPGVATGLPWVQRDFIRSGEADAI